MHWAGLSPGPKTPAGTQQAPVTVSWSKASLLARACRRIPPATGTWVSHGHPPPPPLGPGNPSREEGPQAPPRPGDLTLWPWRLPGRGAAGGEEQKDWLRMDSTSARGRRTPDLVDGVDLPPHLQAGHLGGGGVRRLSWVH